MSKLAEQLIHSCVEKGLTLATAESCTGGGLGAVLTSVSGSSKVFMGGFITYSNEVKVNLLGVGKALINENGAVSEPIAAAMAQGALTRLNVDIAVAITGIAGPKSDDTLKPVGLVYIAVATQKGTLSQEFKFGDIGRENVRKASIESALEMIVEAIKNPA
jgi:nicotinamide-nucleotide amidase